MLNLDALNDAQRKAVTHGEGALLVLAGPGSGKTFTIVQRIFYLLEVCKVPAEEILVVTFTKDAALSMQNRFREQSESIHPVNFGTFHSIFYHILRESHTLQKHKIATDKEKRAILKTVLKQVCLQTETKQVTQFLSAISFYKNTGDETGALFKLSEEDKSVFFRVLNMFQNACNQAGLLDFDDMVYLCKDLLQKDSSVREKWQKRFRYILMDEFQDINPMQYQAIKMLAGANTQLFAVGDDDQAIYGFRGSNPACLKLFQEEMKAQIVHLNINYRSRSEIVDASVKVISQNQNRFEKDLKAAGACNSNALGKNQKDNATETAFQILSFEEKESQYQYLAEQIKKEIADKEKNIAVLFRTNAHMQSFAVRCNRLEIPYEMKEKSSSIYDHFIVRDLMAYLELVTDRTNRNAILQILNKPDRQLDREALGFGNGIQDIKRYYEYELVTDENKKKRMFDSLDKWQSDMERMKRMPLFLQISYIRKGIGYECYLKELAKTEPEKWEEWMEILEFILSESKNYEDLEKWKQAQSEYEKKLRSRENTSEKRESGIKNKTKGMVRLMTVHASKGLEFDEVYIPDCNENVYPHGKMPDKNAVEEERRIFYVAMTRAKKHLELLCVTGTKERPRVLSRFLNSLREQ